MLVVFTCCCHYNQIYFVDECNLCTYLGGGDGLPIKRLDITSTDKNVYKEITDITDLIVAIST